MTQTRTYRNDATGYRVTLTDNGRDARVTDSLGYDFPMVGADYPHAAVLAASRARLNGAVEVATPAPAQMTSPLAADAQVRSERPLVAGVIGLPTLPQARCLKWATDGGQYGRAIRRGHASHVGNTATRDQLVAMHRRGWVTLDNATRPTAGAITKAGAAALAAYVAKHGEVL